MKFAQKGGGGWDRKLRKKHTANFGSTLARELVQGQCPDLVPFGRFYITVGHVFVDLLI